MSTNGNVERMIREVIRGAKAMFNEGGRPLSELVVTLPAVQWAFNTAWRKRLQTTRYQFTMGVGHVPQLPACFEGDGEGFQFSPIDDNKLQPQVVSHMYIQNERG